jgi:ATP-binding cassette subfamily C protein CydD
VVVARWLAVPLGDGTLIAFAVPFFMAYRPLRDLGDARTALERGAASLASLESAARPASRAALSSPSGAMGRRTGVGTAPQRRWERAVLEVRKVGVVRDDLDVAMADGRDVAPEEGRPEPSEALRLESTARGEESRTSFVLYPGEIVAIVGPTGSGKTTLLRALLGLEPGARGSVRYGGAELLHAGVGPFERPFAWAPQDAPLLAGSLEENVLLGRTDPRTVIEVLRSLGAERLARDCAGVELGASGRPVSGGERKWIALARAIASELPVLLLDEPTAGLDAAAQHDLLQALQRLRPTRAIVVVTHLRDAERWADRVVAIGSSPDDQNWASSRGSFSKSKRRSGMS